MGREVRRVPATWRHPKDKKGHYIPLCERPGHSKEEIEEALRDGWGFMPDWPAEERTHLMMYETTTEGTPISPAFETPEELAQWLAHNGASALGSRTATYEQWLAMAKRGWAPSAIMSARGRLVSGVEAMGAAERLFTVVVQDWEESERGWGTRPDGYTLHLSEEDRKAFIKAYNQKHNNQPTVPDEYTRPCGPGRLLEVGPETYEKMLTAKTEKGIWGPGQRAPGQAVLP